MQPSATRRDFLRTALAAAGSVGVSTAATWGAPAKPPPEADLLTTYQLGPHIWVRWANRVLTSYRAHPTQKYPYLFPLAGPLSGRSLTTETALPYPHHRSLIFACDKVNGGNYWQDALERGQIISSGPKIATATPRSCEIRDQCQWRRPGQPPVMKDQRKIAVRVASPRLRLIDLEIQWSAVEDVAIPRTNHSLFAIRAAAELTPWGGGALVNSAGQSGERATFGQPAAWCDFSGKRGGPQGEVVEGIAILDHPNNPWSPCPWFTRDYGFISPTPFNFRDEPWRLPAGQSVTLRYRVVLHAGDSQQADLDGLYKEWVAG